MGRCVLWDLESQNAGKLKKEAGLASWYFNVKFIGRREGKCGGGDSSDHVFIRWECATQAWLTQSVHFVCEKKVRLHYLVALLDEIVLFRRFGRFCE